MSGTQDAEQVTLSPEAWQTADEIRRRAGLASIEDAIRLALGDELYFRKHIDEGYSVLLSRRGEYWEVDLTNKR